MSHYNDPQESTPYDDEDLIVLAKGRLHLEFTQMESGRAMDFLSSLELTDMAHWWMDGKMEVINRHLENLRRGFIDHYLHSEIDLIVEESKQSAAEAYADYLSDR